MIYTLTLNPAIDVSLHVKDGLMPGSINKSYSMRSDPGGKGINVSKTLKSMGKDSVVCVGICGEDGDKLKAKLETEFKVISVVYPSGNTRTNIKITGENGVTTDINAEGPYYDKASVDNMKEILKGRLKAGDIVIICGRPPLGSPSDIYADLVSSFKQVEGVKVILDSADKYLREGLKAVPYAVKPTCDELGMENDREAALGEASEIVSGGVSCCMVSMGKDGAVFVNDLGDKFTSEALNVKVNCTTGCGDAMVAGLAYSFEEGMKPEETFRLCMALATASAETEGTKPPFKYRVMELCEVIPICGQ